MHLAGQRLISEAIVGNGLKGLVHFLEMNSYSLTTPQPAPLSRAQSGGATALDQLLGSKSNILNTKLEILVAELRARVQIWDRNHDRIDQDQERISDALHHVARLANYQLRDHRQTSELYNELAQVAKERRAQDVEAWRDLVDVIRDLLVAWEAHELARSRAIFLGHAGTGTQTVV